MTRPIAERPDVASHSNRSEASPRINVTPLIDVLLVVLIIFLVLTPLKPARFMTAVPSKPDRDDSVQANIDTLVVTIKSDRSLMLNSLTDMGSVNDTTKLSATLSDLFQQRLQNHAYSDRMRDRIDLPDVARIERTVFIKAPRSIPYGEVVRVLDGIRGAGASPVGLQIDDLN
jgi:biopolymer transport protein ExbD